jgi:hypothetical protein
MTESPLPLFGDPLVRRGKRVKRFEIRFIEVDLVRLRGELLSDRPGHRFWCVVDEKVAPNFPRPQHRVVSTYRSKLVKQGRIIVGQIIEDTLSVFENEGIQENEPLDPIGKLFHYLLNHPRNTLHYGPETYLVLCRGSRIKA